MLADDSHIDECAPGANPKQRTSSAAAALLGGVAENWSSHVGAWIVLGLVALVGWAWCVAVRRGRSFAPLMHCSFSLYSLVALKLLIGSASRFFSCLQRLSDPTSSSGSTFAPLHRNAGAR
jgi:hypothetical protein